MLQQIDCAIIESLTLKISRSNRHDFPLQFCGNPADYIWEIVKIIFFPGSSKNELKIEVCVLMARLDTLTYLHRPRLLSLCIFLWLMSVSKFIIQYIFDLYLQYALFLLHY